MIKLVIFDIGGVIVDFWEELYYDYLSGKTGIKKTEIKKIFEPLIVRSEFGTLRQSDMEHIASTRLGIPHSHLEWNNAYKHLAKTNFEVVDIIKKLRKRYTVVMLSNIGRSRLNLTRRYFVNKKWDGKIFASCNIGMRKPDPKIYRYVIRKMHAVAEETLFIDNMRENVEGAKKAGLQSIVFKNSMQLKMDLATYGLFGGYDGHRRHG
ncbi:MAG: HAD family phosphatase [Candidatus Marsarchaeota archaeon]|nr:HAD family phosphatase [Candidatus Marsarchaeota archaeon]